MKREKAMFDAMEGGVVDGSKGVKVRSRERSKRKAANFEISIFGIYKSLDR